MALDLDAARDDPTVYVGESFVIREGDVVLPPLSREVYSQFPACPRFVEEFVVDELTRCVFCVKSLVAIDLYHGQDSSFKAWADTITKHTTGKSKAKLVRGPVVRVIHQSIAKRHHFENCSFYKVLYGRQTEREGVNEFVLAECKEHKCKTKYLSKNSSNRRCTT